jgi:putative hydrolase of the HAD superfamily
MFLDNIKAVIIDLDDTLYPEEEFIYSGFKAVSLYLQQKGIVKKDLYGLMLQNFKSGNRTEIFNEALKSENIEPKEELVNSLIKMYRSHKPDISLFTDAVFFLDRIHGQKKLGLLTDGYLNVQKNKVAALGIEHLFNIIVYTDEMGRGFWKPHQAGYEKTMNKLGVTGNECIYIGDNPTKDFFSANKLGWKTVQIKRPGGVYSCKEALNKDFAANTVLEGFSQLF